MTLKPEVLAAMDKADQFCGTYERGFAVKNAWETIRAELLAMDARLGEAEGLLRDCAEKIRPTLYGNYVHAAMVERIRLYLQRGAAK